MPLHTPKGPLNRIFIVALTVFTALHIHSAEAQRVVGPEDRNITCTKNADCAVLGASAGEDPRCVTSACVSGLCSKQYLTGKKLGADPAPSPMACSRGQLVCGSSGQVTLDVSPSAITPFNDNNPCSTSLPINATCQQAKCSNGTCRVFNTNGVACPDPNGDICKRGICSAGTCASVKVDNAQLKKTCKPTDVVGCVQTSYACAATGCTPTKQAKSEVQCGSDSSGTYLGAANLLPISFVNRQKTVTPKPPYTCSESCLLQYCGNNIIDLPGEECDGTAVNQPVAPGATCQSNCTLTKAPQCSITAARTAIGSEVCNINVTSTGGPVTSLAVNGVAITDPSKSPQKLQLPCHLASDITFTGVARGPVSPEATCASTVPSACIYSFHEEVQKAAGKDYVYMGSSVNLPSCLTTMISDCKSWVDEMHTTSDPKKKAQIGSGMCKWEKGVPIETCLAHSFRNCMLYKNGYLKNGLKISITATPGPNQAFFTQLTDGIVDFFNTWSTKDPTFSDKHEFYPYVYMDSSCQYKGYSLANGKSTSVAPNTGLSTKTLSCGSAFYYAQSSPISLILDDGYDIEAHQAVVPFPVNLGHPDKFYTWKASAQAPLLVYDPAHTGRITSPTQLFGNWTFGGQRLASREMGAMSTQWENGYSALASLDANGDEKISDLELKDIALWFDANQNAIAESGEVQSLNQHGIKELYVTPDGRDERTRSISASKGYMRISDGKTVYGRSVDWYAAASESVDSLLRSAMTGQNLNAKGQAANEHKSSSTASLGESLGIEGTWQWMATSSPEIAMGNVPKGQLIIAETADGGLSINSIVVGEARALSGSEHLSEVSVVDMTGKAIRKAEGTPEIEFNSSPDIHGVSIHSKATLVDNGARLTGYSEAVSTDEHGATKTIRYEWSATRR